MGCNKSKPQKGKATDVTQVTPNIEDNKEKAITYDFSSKLKYKKLIVQNENLKICESNQDLQQYILVDREIDLTEFEKPQKIQFRINKFDSKYNLMIGIAHKDTLQNGQFFKKRWFDEIDHGVYCIDDFGHCFSNVEEKYNNVKIVGWGYSMEPGCIIKMEVDAKKKKLIFKKIYQQKQFQDFILPFSTKEVEYEGQLHYFLCLGGNTQIEILENQIST